MPSYTYTDFHTPLHLTTANITAANTEALVDEAINLVNLYSNQPISIMSGTAGSKTVTLSSKQKGAVQAVFRSIYYRDYMSQLTASTGGVSGAPGQIDDPEVVAKRVASYLDSYSAKLG